jgi:DNA-binding XRE family transcriptional regulator
MTNEVLGNYLRVQRRRCGLSQRDLGLLVGYEDGNAIGTHELSKSVPPLLVALAYEVVFDTPVGELFTGFRSAVEQSVARGLAELRADLDAKGRRRKPNPEKKEWLANHRIR